MNKTVSIQITNHGGAFKTVTLDGETYKIDHKRIQRLDAVAEEFVEMQATTRKHCKSAL